MQRIKHLESVRGLASLLVYLGHFTGAFYPFIIFGYWPDARYFLHTRLEVLLYKTPLAILVSSTLALNLFFILSGYVLSFNLIGKSNVRTRILGSALKRPVRLVGMIWFSIIVSYVIWNAGGYYNKLIAPLSGSIPWFRSFWGEIPPLRDFLSDLLLHPFSSGVTYNSPLWMMSIELSGSMLTFAYLFLFGGHRFRLGVLIPALGVLWGTYHAGFIFGILCGEIQLLLRERNLILPRWILSSILLIGIYFGSYPLYLAPETRAQTIYGILPVIEFFPGYCMIGGFLIFLPIMLDTRWHTLLDHPWLVRFGHVSYSIYTMHFLILGSISSVVYYWCSFRVGHHASALISFLVSAPVMILVAVGASRLVDDRFSRLADAVSTLTQKKITQWLNKYRDIQTNRFPE